MEAGREQEADAGIARLPAAARIGPQQAGAGDRRHCADDDPLALAGHEAAADEVEALQSPKKAEKDEDRADDVPNDFHRSAQRPSCYRFDIGM
ncbi:MAG: hypothetical protein NVSMB26_05750 [Beijerinckiaceae bacterium]